MAATDSLEPILIVLWIYSTSTRNFWAPIESPNDDQVQLQDGLKSIDKAQLSRARSLCITTVVLNTWGFVASVLSPFLKLVNLHIVVNHYHLVKCIPSSRYSGILCLENILRRSSVPISSLQKAMLI